MALKDNAVSTAIALENTRIAMVPDHPAYPTANPTRMKSTAPRMFSRHGMNTPLIVPS